MSEFSESFDDLPFLYRRKVAEIEWALSHLKQDNVGHVENMHKIICYAHIAIRLFKDQTVIKRVVS